MKFKGSLTSLHFDLEGYRKRLHEHLSEEIAHAAFVWLNTVLDEIPTWSGASRATFLALSREVGFNLSISPIVKSDISTGIAHSKGKMTSDSSKGEYTFEYGTDLRHLVWNEFNSPEGDPAVFAKLKKPGPYRFQEKGREVFKQVAADVRLPDPWKSLKTTKVKVG